MNIRLIKREELELPRYNGCVHYSTNGNIYGYSWYLDQVAENWDVLVEDNYESVFPLVWNSKIPGYKQLYQPYLCQQLGLFSVNVLSKSRIRAFLEAIPEEYRRININLNDRNVINEMPGFEINKVTNYLLRADLSYEGLYANYSKSLKRNLKRAAKNNLTLTSNVKPEKLVALSKEFHKSQGHKIPEDLFHAAHRVIYNCLHRGKGFLSGVLTKEGELCAAAFFMIDNARVTNLLNVSTPKGKELNAMHLLLDMQIRNQAGKPIIIDFEGSSIPSIARFYRSFGASDIPYYSLKKNTLPRLYKLFIK